ncbi:MAG: hypothetical protein SNJ64_02670, partial [Endomicrobiia bacterium]
MTKKEYIKILLIIGLVFISLGGWFLHMRVHPANTDKINYIPYISGILSVFIIPCLFMFVKTTPYAYLINGMIVIIGTITMVHYS